MSTILALATWREALGAPGVEGLCAIREAALPLPELLTPLLRALDPALWLVVAWIRPAAVRREAGPAWRAPALRWLQMSNAAAAATVYAAPDWWADWLEEGYPTAQQALAWLGELPLLPEPGEDPVDWRHRWLESALIPSYRRIGTNLLLAKAAAGEDLSDVLALAQEGFPPALRALALTPTPAEAHTTVLLHALHSGKRPVVAAARAALEHLAQRRGLPGVEELERQVLLSAAWEPGALAGERVRVGWPVGGYRFRLSLQQGRVGLETLGPHGPVNRLPADVRHSDGYRQARIAQRETQEQYRLFRQHLERRMLEGTPFPAREFSYLLANPVYAHLAERLLWTTGNGDTFLWAAPGRWETLVGTRVAVDDGMLTLLLAHPAALVREETLGAWQQRAAERRLVQPFKQLFREVYLPGDGIDTHCLRFAGRRVDPRRAYAVLRAAGYAPGSGTARREWRGGVTAHLCWADGATGGDLFGPGPKEAAVTGAIWFTRHGDALPLPTVDPIIFSETLRAADLLTTRAVVGEADLTARETVALRAMLLRDVARSFRLTNVVVKEDSAYALVLGARATYRVNLTSGTVLLEPEGRQITTPHYEGHWQPTEDADATTSLLTLILTLAQDDDITDLAFLAQLGVAPMVVR